MGVSNISFIGEGGLSFDRLMSNRGRALRTRVEEMKPDVLVLVIGANDLDSESRPSVCDVIVRLLTTLDWIQTLETKTLIMPLFKRSTKPRQGRHKGRGDYNEVLNEFNQVTKFYLDNTERAGVGRFLRVEDKDLIDDVHLTDQGYGRLLLTIKGSLHKAI